MAQLEISERQEDTSTILDLKGDFVFGDGTTQFRSALRDLIRDGKKDISLNLSDVGYLDSSGIGELISGLTAVNRVDGAQLKLLNPTNKIMQLLTISKLLTVFEIDYDDDRAAAGF